MAVKELSLSLLRSDAEQICVNEFETVRQWWSEIRELSTVGDIPDQDSEIARSFSTLDAIINDKMQPPQLKRLCYVAIANVFEKIKEKVGISRRQGRIKSRPGATNASYALQLYLQAQNTDRNLEHAKCQLYRHLRITKRWRELGGKFPIMLVTYSSAAEKIM